MSDPWLLTESIRLLNSTGDLVRGDVRYRDDGKIKPVVIVCHSFMAFKNWGFFPHVGKQLARHGFVSIVFDFSHNGVEDDDRKITDFAKFSENTFSRELDDLNTVVDAVTSGAIGKNVPLGTPVGLLGHSRGGGIAIVHAASDARITSLVSWSAIATFDRWTRHQKERWNNEGFLPLSSDAHVSPLRLGMPLLRDLEENGTKLNILDAAARLEIPWLILHGSADATVRPGEAELLYGAAKRPMTELKLLDHVGHLYIASTRKEDGYSTLDKIIQTTVDWFSRHLS
jgi:alpha-beta hydrolase superfamily lysophospholipase